VDQQRLQAHRHERVAVGLINQMRQARCTDDSGRGRVASQTRQLGWPQMARYVRGHRTNIRAVERAQTDSRSWVSVCCRVSVVIVGMVAWESRSIRSLVAWLSRHGRGLEARKLPATRGRFGQHRGIGSAAVSEGSARGAIRFPGRTYGTRAQSNIVDGETCCMDTCMLA
jgi:hypothetical protein